MEALAVGMGEGCGGVGMEPFAGENSSDEAISAGDRGCETTGAEGGAVNEEVEFVGGFAAKVSTVEGNGEDTVLDLGSGDGNHRYGTFTDDDAGKVDVAIGSEAVFVEVLEEGIGAVVFANRQPVETHEVGILHIG